MAAVVRERAPACPGAQPSITTYIWDNLTLPGISGIWQWVSGSALLLVRERNLALPGIFEISVHYQALGARGKLSTKLPRGWHVETERGAHRKNEHE